MYILIKDDNLFEEYGTILDKVIVDINKKKQKKIDSDPVYNKFFLKTKIKSHGNEVTDFHDKDITKVGHHILV